MDLRFAAGLFTGELYAIELYCQIAAAKSRFGCRKLDSVLQSLSMFDAVALAAVADELNEKILRGRVQEIVELDALTFGFEIYANHVRQYLFASARPDDARVHLASQKLRASGDAATPFKLLLQKHLEGAFVDAITQIPNERVLKIQFDHQGDLGHSDEGISTLVVETIGRYSNLILLDTDAIILDAARRVTPKLNRLRTILPRQIYAPPPPQAKTNLSALTIEKLTTILDENRGAALAQTLVKNVAGVSPLFAREVEFRVNARSSLNPPLPRGVGGIPLILETLTQLSHAPWQPSVAFEDDEPSDFAPYQITQSPKHQTFESISKAIETFYGAEEQYAALKETLAAKIKEAREKLARKRDSLASSMPRDGEIERLKTSGELILGYASEVRAGQEVLKAETEMGFVNIPLNPQLSVVENAQKYFKDYHRAKDAARRVPALLQAAQQDLDYADQILNDLDLAENRAEIEAVAQAAREARLVVESKRQRVKIAPSEPRAFESRDGFIILVGKNAKQNEEVTFKSAKPDDLWLHARTVAGAHVVILGLGREIPESTVMQAALLAAQNSQARSESRVDVIVTERKNVRKPRGAKPGMVTVRGERVVRVEIGS